jgi:hypothetical protein
LAHDIFPCGRAIITPGQGATHVFKTNLILKLLLSIAILGSSLALVGQDQSASQDMKDAGHHTKQAAKHTGSATKKTAKKTGHTVKSTTKKGVHKTASKTKEGAQKVEDKTQPSH